MTRLVLPRAVRSLVAVACIAVVLAAHAATADFPTRPVHLYIGSNPAGSTDMLGRVLANELEAELGQPVVVHNRPGAGGGVMAAQLKSAAPDGYSVGLTISHAYTGNPAVTPSAARYGVRDFTHLGSVSKGQCALVTSASKPYRTLADLIAAAKRGERPIYASQSPLTKIVADYIAQVAGVSFRVITVQGGGETMQAILGGHADFAFSGGPHIDYVAAGKMRVLASTEDERLPSAPDAPTLKELGYDLSSCAVFVVSAPPNLPQDVELALAAALSSARASPAMSACIARLRYPEYRLGPGAVSAVLEAEATAIARAVDEVRRAAR
jgi:tripartite-type tricarboxylate transporter receptor subunit TctC